MPSAVATTKIADALIKLLVPAHTISPMTMSSMSSGVASIPAQVCCVVMRV